MFEKSIFPEDLAGMEMRSVFGNALVIQGDKHENLVMLGADGVESTRAIDFANNFPERSFNFGIAEQEMLSASAGFALCGKIPVVAAYGFLISLRGCEQVRTDICYPNLNVKLVATHTGLSMGPGGTTHHSTEDIAIMRSFANMTVIAPADPYELVKALDAAILHPGPVYLRAGRGPTPAIFSDAMVFKIGQSHLLRDGHDVTLIAYGSMVEPALQAGEILARDSIEARVLNMSTIKPLDEKAIISAAQETGAIVTAEEHNIIGGLGEAVAGLTSRVKPVPIQMVAINDTFCGIGPEALLWQKHGLTAENIVMAAKKAITFKEAKQIG
jgi:transketolase